MQDTLNRPPLVAHGSKWLTRVELAGPRPLPPIRPLIRCTGHCRVPHVELNMVNR